MSVTTNGPSQASFHPDSQTLGFKPFSILLSIVLKFQTGKTPEEIRKTFNIKNDFTPEEEEQVIFR